MRNRVPCVFLRDRHFFAIHGMAAYRCRNRCGVLPNVPVHHCLIFPGKAMLLNLCSKAAVTHYTVLGRYTGFTHLLVRLETGRTHQIRVHMAYIGHPVAGDPVYGPKKTAQGLNGQCLHAWKIGFVHPLRGTYMEFTSPLPAYFAQFLQRLAKDT